jgi:16S rRNA (guanine527-N7)-methyltransferase
MADGDSAGAMDTARLLAACASVGCPLDDGQVAACARYAEELLAWNARVNLTRLTRPEELAVQHIADSLVCLWGVPPDCSAPGAAVSCVDVGTGAGLPGLALAVVRPAWRVTLADAVGKKVAFVDHAIRVLGLPGCTALHARAEDLGRDPAQRGRHDLAVARAVAHLAVLAEYLLPLLRVGGRAVALKGAHVTAELAAAGEAIATLGGQLAELRPYTLPGLDGPRHAVILAKVRPSPSAYPRRAGLPSQRPLGDPGSPPPGPGAAAGR